MLHSALKIDNEVVNINPLILFSWHILLAEHGEETTLCFEYELKITRLHSLKLVWWGMTTKPHYVAS